MSYEKNQVSRRTFAAGVGIALGLGHNSNLRLANQTGQEILDVGTTNYPTSLNLFRDYDNSPGVFSSIYDRGAVIHPERKEPVGWAYSNWEFPSSNNRQLSVKLRENLRWSNGNPVTTGDVQFTISHLRDYLSDHAEYAAFSLVERVQETDDRTVTIYFSEEIGSRLYQILRAPVIPQSVWGATYGPANRDVTNPIGSGPFTVSRYTDQELVLSPREGYSHPAVEDLSFVDEPDISIRLRRIPNDSQQAIEAIGNGDIALATTNDPDFLYDSVPTVEQTQGVKPIESPAGTIRRLAFNTDLRPLVDPVFRRYLCRAWQDEVYFDLAPQQISREGTFVAPPDSTELTPSSSTVDDLFEFFSDSNGEADLARFHQYLKQDEDAIFGYTFEPAVSDGLPNTELYINGEPFGEYIANERPGGNRLRILTANPPPSVESMLEQWTQTVERIGVPTETRIIDEETLEQRVHVEQDFDIYEGLWRISDPKLSRLPIDYGPLGIEIDGYSQNPMGYTRADSLGKAAKAASESEYRELLRDALIKIYQDAPVYVYDHPRLFEPVATEWDSGVRTIGGVGNQFTWTNTSTTTPRSSTQTPESTAESSNTTEGNNESVEVGGGNGGDNENPMAIIRGIAGVGALGLALGVANHIRKRRNKKSKLPFEMNETSSSSVSNAQESTAVTNSSANQESQESIGSETDDKDQVDTSKEPESEETNTVNNTTGTSENLLSSAPEINNAVKLRSSDYLTTYNAELQGAKDTVRVKTPTPNVGEDATMEFIDSIREWNGATGQGNIRDVYDWDDEPEPWVAVEPLHGGLLTDIVADLSESEKLRILGSICDAIRHASLYNTWHLSLRPESICFSDDANKTPIIRDWGIESAVQSASDVSMEVTPYHAPEQIDSERFGPTGAHTDRYRVGAIAYYLLTGEPPYDPDDSDLAEKICAGDVVAPSKRNKDLSESYDEPILKLMSPNSEDRYQSLHHFHLALQD